MKKNKKGENEINKKEDLFKKKEKNEEKVKTENPKDHKSKKDDEINNRKKTSNTQKIKKNNPERSTFRRLKPTSIAEMRQMLDKMEKNLNSVKSGLFSDKTSFDEKKNILMKLAHLGVPDALRIIDEFLAVTEGELKEWAQICKGECQLFIDAMIEGTENPDDFSDVQEEFLEDESFYLDGEKDFKEGDFEIKEMFNFSDDTACDCEGCQELKIQEESEGVFIFGLKDYCLKHFFVFKTEDNLDQKQKDLIIKNLNEVAEEFSSKIGKSEFKNGCFFIECFLSISEAPFEFVEFLLEACLVNGQELLKGECLISDSGQKPSDEMVDLFLDEVKKNESQE